MALGGERGTVRRLPWVTLVLVGLCVLVYAGGGAGIAQSWGFAPSRLADRPWTVVTALFTHISANHLSSNVLVLAWAGTLLEQTVGHRKTLAAFFLCGWGGWAMLCLSEAVHPVLAGSLTAGASGAMLGMAVAAVLLRRRGLPVWLLAAATIFVLATSFMGTVSWQAHLGGVLMGMVLAFVWRGQWARMSNHPSTMMTSAPSGGMSTEWSTPSAPSAPGSDSTASRTVRSTP